MSIFLYLLGCAAGIAVFLYIFSTVNSGKEKIKKLSYSHRSENEKIPEEKKQGHPVFTIPPGERMCPICRNRLNKYEALYASKIKAGNQDKILIHGCRYCYKEDRPEHQLFS